MECRLSPISQEDLLIGGGTTVLDFQRFLYYVKIVIQFIADYREEMYRGFERGWKTF